jgi:hypothetical protein
VHLALDQQKSPQDSKVPRASTPGRAPQRCGDDLGAVLRTGRTAATSSFGFWQVRFDRRRNDRQGESAMTTAALTRDSSSAELIGLAGVFAIIIFVVVLVLPL